MAQEQPENKSQTEGKSNSETTEQQIAWQEGQDSSDTSGVTTQKVHPTGQTGEPLRTHEKSQGDANSRFRTEDSF